MCDYGDLFLPRKCSLLLLGRCLEHKLVDHGFEFVRGSQGNTRTALAARVRTLTRQKRTALSNAGWGSHIGCPWIVCWNHEVWNSERWLRDGGRVEIVNLGLEKFFDYTLWLGVVLFAWTSKRVWTITCIDAVSILRVKLSRCYIGFVCCLLAMPLLKWHPWT